MSAINTVTLIISILSALGLAGLTFVVYKFIKTLTPYQFEKLKGRKISHTKISKNIGERLELDLDVLIQEPILLDLFPQAVTYAVEKKAAPNFFLELIKRAAPLIPSLAAGVPAEQVAAGEAAKMAAGVLGSDAGMEQIKNIWGFIKMIAQARKEKQVALPQKMGSTKDTESTTI